MTRLSVVPFLLCTLIPAFAHAADKPTTVSAKPLFTKPSGAPRDLPSLAARADAIVVARVENISPKPAETSGSVSLAIENDFKGPLGGGRDYIWIPKSDLPKAEIGAQLWLLCLERTGDGFWRVLAGEHSPSAVDSANAPAVRTAAESAYLLGRAPEDRFGDSELAHWVHKAGKGSKKARNEAFTKLLEAGPRARVQLSSAEASTDPEIANIARRLLPLSNGGPASAGISLLMDPFRFALADGEKRNITVQYANLTDRDIRIVTGTSAWGDNVMAATAYDVRKLDKDSDARTSTEFLKAELPENYAKPLQEGAAPLPLVRVAPSFGTHAIVVQIELEKTEVAGVTRRVLKFPHGKVELPGDGTGRYSIKARFECAGPRPDQKQLIASNFWQGGRLTSNEIILTIR